MKSKYTPKQFLLYIGAYVLIVAVMVVVAYFIGHVFFHLSKGDVIIILILGLLAVGIGTIKGMMKIRKKRKD
jgi:membrane protein DedA with SNARE-associated domain